MTTQKRPPSAAIVLRRPARTLTRSAMLDALEPLVDLMQLDLDEVLSLTITPKEVRVHLVPMQRGRRVHNARVRVVWPIALDPDPDER